MEEPRYMTEGMVELWQMGHVRPHPKATTQYQQLQPDLLRGQNPQMLYEISLFSVLTQMFSIVLLSNKT